MADHHFELFADYHQIYLQDLDSAGPTGTEFTETSLIRRAAEGPGFVVMMTARNTTVPVTLGIHLAPPREDLRPWDHVIETGIDLTSGVVTISGCTDYLPDAARLPLRPGHWRVRISMAGLDTLGDDGLDGADRYRMDLWPGHPAPLRFLKLAR